MTVKQAELINMDGMTWFRAHNSYVLSPDPSHHDSPCITAQLLLDHGVQPHSLAST